jgi:hypothetical protein
LVEADEAASAVAGNFERVFNVRLEPMPEIPEPPRAHRIARCGQP